MAAQPASAEHKRLLASYQPPDLDPALDEALQTFMARRKAKIKPEY